MSEIFISYARSTEQQARRVAEALRGLGYGVWRDDELPAHRDYSEVIEERLRAAKAVVVVWSAEAVKSQWVRAEADIAREAGTLVQLSLDGAPLPMPFNRIQCADMAGWSGDLDNPGWEKVARSVAELAGAGLSPAPTAASAVPARSPLPDKPSIAVLAFSDPIGAGAGDYFADGLVEEITTALSRFRSFVVVDSGSSLAYRNSGKSPREVARELGVRYVLEGSIRRSGRDVRTNVRLVDTIPGAQIWAERFDGLLDDVFELQDDVATAVAGQIVATIEAQDLGQAAQHPTSYLTAHQLWLRARDIFRRSRPQDVDEIVALLDQALATDPSHARALALRAACVSMRINSIAGAERSGGLRRTMLRDLDRAVAVGGDEPVVLAYAALAHFASNLDPVTGRALADRARQLNPGLGGQRPLHAAAGRGR